METIFFWFSFFQVMVQYHSPLSSLTLHQTQFSSVPTSQKTLQMWFSLLLWDLMWKVSCYQMSLILAHDGSFLRCASPLGRIGRWLPGQEELNCGNGNQEGNFRGEFLILARKAQGLAWGSERWKFSLPFLERKSEQEGSCFYLILIKSNWDANNKSKVFLSCHASPDWNLQKGCLC